MTDPVHSILRTPWQGGLFKLGTVLLLGNSCFPPALILAWRLELKKGWFVSFHTIYSTSDIPIWVLGPIKWSPFLAGTPAFAHRSRTKVTMEDVKSGLSILVFSVQQPHCHLLVTPCFLVFFWDLHFLYCHSGWLAKLTPPPELVEWSYYPGLTNQNNPLPRSHWLAQDWTGDCTWQYKPPRWPEITSCPATDTNLGSSFSSFNQWFWLI